MTERMEVFQKIMLFSVNGECGVSGMNLEIIWILVTIIGEFSDPVMFVLRKKIEPKFNCADGLKS